MAAFHFNLPVQKSALQQKKLQDQLKELQNSKRKSQKHLAVSQQSALSSAHLYYSGMTVHAGDMETGHPFTVHVVDDLKDFRGSSEMN